MSYKKLEPELPPVTGRQRLQYRAALRALYYRWSEELSPDEAKAKLVKDYPEVFHGDYSKAPGGAR